MSVEDTFSTKADVYATARPPWDDVDVDALLADVGLPTGDLTGFVIVDVGAGSGMLTEHFTRRGAQVIAVEPNEKMRAKLQENLGHCANLVITDGGAGDLRIPQEFEGRVDLIVSGNAQHWWGRHAPGNADPHAEETVAASWAKVAGPKAKLAIAFNKMVETAAPVVRLQEIGMQYFPAKMSSPFAPAATAPFTADQFSEYFNGESRAYHRPYNMVFRAVANFRDWLLSHSFISDQAFENAESRGALEELYDSLPENAQGGKIWPYCVHLYTGALRPQSSKYRAYSFRLL